MIALTQEKRQKKIDWLKDRISSMEQCRDEIPFGLSEDESMELSAYKDSLASLTAEPVAYTSEFALVDVYIGDTAMMGKWNEVGDIPLFTAPPVPEIKLPESLFKVSSSLNSQDNRYTDQPMFVVYQKKEIIGSDDHSPSRIVWLVDGEEVSETKARRLETLHQEFREVDSKYQRYAAQEVDEFVTACFTEQGCKDFLSINGHNLRRPFIVAEGSFRNHEYQAVRNWLISLNGLGE